MDELKKKVEELTPQNAFYAYFGVAALVLLLFLVAPFVGIKGESINGFNVLFGKESVTFGTGTLFGYLYVISVIGVLYLAYTKKRESYLRNCLYLRFYMQRSGSCYSQTSGTRLDRSASHGCSRRFRLSPRHSSRSPRPEEVIPKVFKRIRYIRQTPFCHRDRMAFDFFRTNLYH